MTTLLLIGLVAIATPFLIAYRITRRDRRDREAAVILARAEYQHSMLIRGHHGMGIYGNFQPPAELRTPLLGIDA